MYTGAIEAVRGSVFGADSIPFVATFISCLGTESQLSDCYGFTAYQSYVQYCHSNRAAGVKCLGKKEDTAATVCTGVYECFFFFLFMTELLNGPPPIRLVNGTTNHDGRVEIFIQVGSSLFVSQFY